MKCEPLYNMFSEVQSKKAGIQRFVVHQTYMYRDLDLTLRFINLKNKTTFLCKLTYSRYKGLAKYYQVQAICPQFLSIVWKGPAENLST